METNVAFVKGRIRLKLFGANQPGTFIDVHWQENTLTSGVWPIDPVTGATLAVQVEVSGTLPVFWHQVSASTKLRQFSEIQMGDVIIDLDPLALIRIYPGQQVSGTLPIDTIANKGVRFHRAGQVYTQAEIGERLAEAWSVVVGGQEILRTMLLRKAT